MAQRTAPWTLTGNATLILAGALLAGHAPIAAADAPGVAAQASSTTGSRAVEAPEAKPRRYFLGLSYRHIFLPQFMLNTVLDEAPTGSNPALAGEFTLHKERFDLVTSLYWQRFHASGPYRLKGNLLSETEIAQSDLSLIAVGIAFLGAIPLPADLAFQYGLGLGFGVTLGDIRRTEAYQDADGRWRACQGPNDPAPDPFCDTTQVEDGLFGGHYDVRVRRWSEGGALPTVWFRTAPQIGLRYQPTPKVLTRLEGGFDIFSGFFFGLAAAYGF
ncbi:MAG: hypothetical protein ACPGUV_13230 [Polyangiales bacterium]